MMRASGKFSRVLWWSAVAGGAVVACASNEGGIVLESGGTGGLAAGGKLSASGGSAPASGGSSTAPAAGNGGSAGELFGGQTGSEPGEAGSSAGGAPAEAGSSGEGGTFADAGAGPGSAELCVFHTDAPEPSGEPEPEPEPDPSGGAGGAAPQYDVSLKVSPFVGPYLADHEGKALYIYGADFAGDCATPPQSNCVEDCVMSWPLFDAGPRDLQEGLDDALFGRIEREDGQFQTTFYGWPLYYYRSDTEEAPLNGQGRGRTWFVAETVLPNVMILRAPESAGGNRYLGDDRGRALYVFAEDDVGSATRAPVSHCSGDCLDDFGVFTRAAVLPVSLLEPSDLTVFFREDGRSQIAFRGQPLYTSAADTKSGETNGTATEGWSLITL